MGQAIGSMILLYKLVINIPMATARGNSSRQLHSLPFHTSRSTNKLSYLPAVEYLSARELNLLNFTGFSVNSIRRGPRDQPRRSGREQCLEQFDCTCSSVYCRAVGLRELKRRCFNMRGFPLTSTAISTIAVCIPATTQWPPRADMC